MAFPTPWTLVARSTFPGQVWEYKTRLHEEESTLTILKVWTTPDGLDAIHVAVNDLHITDLTGRTRGQEITHAPFTVEALDRSVRELLHESGPVPDFSEEYATWEAEEGGFFTGTVAQAITELENAIRYARPQ